MSCLTRFCINIVQALQSSLKHALLLGPLLGMLAYPVSIVAQEGLDADSESELIPEFVTTLTSRGDILSSANNPVRMRDNVAISVDIFRPVGEDTYSTLYAAGPFPHTTTLLESQDSRIGPIAWYVSQGYAVVVANVRGTGLSEGEFSLLPREEQQDHYEIIEWIAQQPWSDGQVAGTGAGYYGASQWHMAIQNPPHLECIAPINGVIDPFREWVMPGGVANTSFINDWYDRQVRLANAYLGESPRLVNFDLRLAQLGHPVFDEYWQTRSSQDSAALINVPVFVLHEWSLSETDADLTGTMEAMSRLRAINKILIRNPTAASPLYQDTDFLARELMPFYEWCFNGRNPTSVFIERPRIRFQVQGQSTFKREINWPPGNIAHEAWYLNNTPGSEEQTGSLDAEEQTGNLNFSVINQVEDDARISFVSSPLANDVEISGPVMVELYVSSAGPDSAFEVTLMEEEAPEEEELEDIKEAPGLPSFLRPKVTNSASDTEIEPAIETGPRIAVTRGSLKASARAQDPEKSSTYLPVYTLAETATMNPGQVYRLNIALRQTAWRFSAGSRLVLDIKPVNDGSLPGAPGSEMLHHSSQYPSRLWLPVVQSPQALSEASLNAGQSPAEQGQAAEGQTSEAGIELLQNEAPADDVRPGLFVPL